MRMWLKKKWDLPIDYQTGSCHGKKQDDGNIGKSKEMMKNYNGEKCNEMST